MRCSIAAGSLWLRLAGKWMTVPDGETTLATGKASYSRWRSTRRGARPSADEFIVAPFDRDRPGVRERTDELDDRRLGAFDDRETLRAE